MAMLSKIYQRYLYMGIYKAALSSTGVLIGIVLSYYFVDRQFALWCIDKCVGSSNDFFIVLTHFGVSTYYLIPSALLFFYFQYFKKNPLYAYHALFIFSAVALSGITADIIKGIAGRFRPSLFFQQKLYGFDFFHYHSAMTSFPSGHTTTAFALAMYVSLHWPKWAILGWIMAAAVGISRIALSLHYVSDVLAGALFGVLSVQLMMHYWPKKWKAERGINE